MFAQPAAHRRDTRIVFEFACGPAADANMLGYMLAMDLIVLSQIHRAEFIPPENFADLPHDLGVIKERPFAAYFNINGNDCEKWRENDKPQGRAENVDQPLQVSCVKSMHSTRDRGSGHVQKFRRT